MPSHPLLLAFPFVRSPLEAITNLGPQAAGAALRTGLAWRSWLAKYFPSRFQSFQPTRFRAVYYPAWIVDADVRANVSADDEQEKPVRVLYLFYPSCDALLGGRRTDVRERIVDRRCCRFCTGKYGTLSFSALLLMNGISRPFTKLHAR